MIQFKKKMCSGQTCTGEKGDKRCQLGRASSELLMAALFRFSLSSLSHYFPVFSLLTFTLSASSWHLVNLFYLQIVGVAREDEGRYDAFADNGLGVCLKYPSTSSDQIVIVLHRPQWPSMWFCLWTLQGIFLQGLSTQMQMSPCHLVSTKFHNYEWLYQCLVWWMRSMKRMNQDHLPSCIAWPMASQSLQWPGGREQPCCLSPQSVTDRRNSPSVSGGVRLTLQVTGDFQVCGSAWLGSLHLPGL